MPGLFGRNGIPRLRIGRRLSQRLNTRGDRRRRTAVDKIEKAAVSAQVLAIVTGLVAIDEFERAGVVAQGAEEPAQRVAGSSGISSPSTGLASASVRYLVFHVGLFDAPDP